MTFDHYLKTIGLSHLGSNSQGVNANEYVRTWFDQTPPELSSDEIRNLYTYRVPKLGPGGSCSITDELEETPYDLSEMLDFSRVSLFKHPTTTRLWQLNGIIESLHRDTEVDWLGIYKAIEKANGDRVLVKLAYKGAPSRAEFPLTEEFAKNSNNSTVGLTGKAVYFQDIEEYQGPYYKCDSKVQSEFCVPIFNTSGSVSGIIDAESFQKKFFTAERLLQITKVCFDLGNINPFF
jgi:L-methionine (R)-S-oxide reductase